MRILATGAIAAVLGLLSSYGVYQAAAKPDKVSASSDSMFDYSDSGQGGSDKVTICHDAGGKKYVPLTLPKKAVKARNHGNDIVPPVDDQPGVNWDDEGRELLANNCNR